MLSLRPASLRRRSRLDFPAMLFVLGAQSFSMMLHLKKTCLLLAIPLLLYYDQLGFLNPRLLGTWLIWLAAKVPSMKFWS